MGKPNNMMRRIALALAFLVLLVTHGGIVADAQQIPDQDALRRLLEQRQQQADPVPQSSPVDTARQRNEDGETAGTEAGPSKRFELLSPVERDYNARLGFRPEVLEPEIEKPDSLLDDRERQERAERAAERRRLLRQFGYDMLGRATGGADKQLVGRISESYRLGVGDEIVITFVGPNSRSLSTKVDREGRVVVADLPPVAAAGRSLGEFRQDFEALVARSMLGTEAYISIGALRRMNVTVLGAVETPGLMQAGSETDLLEILAGAGGVKRTGSLRRILIQSSEGTRSVDLYGLFDGSADTDIRLRDGDRVIVPLIGPTVALAGDVVRPGIYELLPGEKLTAGSALALAGGAIRPRGYIIDRNRVDETGIQRFSGIDEGDDLLAGDLLRVVPRRSNRTGMVSLVGHVLRQGERSLDSYPSLSALIEGGDALRNDPYLLFAVLERTDPVTLQRIYRPLDLTPIVAGAEDVTLEDRDRLIVAGAEDIRYLSSDAVRLAILSPEQMTGAQTCPAIAELGRRARQADSERLAAVARSVFVVSALGQEQALQEVGNEADEVVTQRTLAAAAGHMRSCNDLFEDYPALLPLFIEYSAVLSGSVRSPGVFPVVERTTLRSLSAAAGGLSLSADPTEIEVTRYLQFAGGPLGTPQREVYSLKTTSLADIAILPGSIVRVGARMPMLEAGTVLLSGEFRRPGVYAIRKGETLSDLIARAGGITDQAYPYGAVFTRERVKREQQESFRRTARELNNALALAMMKNDISGDALTAAAGLVSSFATVEAAGRVVVEADPVILQREPEHDLLLEGGDALFMPKRPNFVLMAGDLLNPVALQFAPGKRIEDYLDETGGFQETADRGRVFIVFPNGVAQPVALSRWSRSNVMVPPGSTIVVPKDVNPLETLNIVREITTVLSNLAVSAASIAVISSN